MSRDTEARKKYLEEYLKRPEVIARRKEIYKKFNEGNNLDPSGKMWNPTRSRILEKNFG